MSTSTDLLEFTIPTWALSSLINGDDSGLTIEDIKKLDAFIADTVDQYGNANFMLGEGSEESYFTWSNDIDGFLGATVTTLYLIASK